MPYNKKQRKIKINAEVKSEWEIILNPDINKFHGSSNSSIYVDKTELLEYLNSIAQTTQKYICISRPRRFGKSITANMIAAYYNCEADSKELFSRFKIASCESFENI